MPLVCLLQSFLDRWRGASHSPALMFQADFKIDVICLKEIFQNLFNRFPPHFVQMLIRGNCISVTSQLLKCTKGHIRVTSWWPSGCRMRCCGWSGQQCSLGLSPELFLSLDLCFFILQLRREKIDLENTLEQEQEALVNRLWKRMDKLEAEKRFGIRLELSASPHCRICWSHLQLYHNWSPLLIHHIPTHSKEALNQLRFIFTWGTLEVISIN